MMKPLYMDFMEDFVFLDRTHTNDGYGGTITTWTDGAAFQAGQRIYCISGKMAGCCTALGEQGSKQTNRQTRSILRRQL